MVRQRAKISSRKFRRDVRMATNVTTPNYFGTVNGVVNKNTLRYKNRLVYKNDNLSIKATYCEAFVRTQ